MERKCYKCGQIKPLEQFKKNKRLTLGYSYCCKICHRKFYKGNLKSLRRRLIRVYIDILKRCGNKDGKHPSYNDIECKVSKEEFIVWATPLFEKFLIESPNDTPSVDRIKNHLHYTLDNMRVISLSKNSKLRHNPDNIEDICRVIQRMSNSANISLTNIAEKLNQIVKEQQKTP